MICHALREDGSGNGGATTRTRRGRRAAQGLVAVGLLVAGEVGADTLAFRGQLDLQLLGLDPLRATGTGLATAAPGPFLQALALPEGLTASTVIPVTDPIVSAGGIHAIRATARIGGGTVGWSPPLQTLTDATLAVPGSVRICLFSADCSLASIDTPLTTDEGGAGVGAGGTVLANPYASMGRVTLKGAPWTVRTASVSAPTPSGASLTILAFGFIHGPLSFTFSAKQTGGEVQLVTPIRAEGLFAETNVAAGFATLNLRFVPEPKTAALVLTGAAAVLCVGARRRRRDPTHPVPEEGGR